MSVMEEDASDIRTRSTATYEDKAQRFLLQKRQFAAQYAQIYFTRLMQLSPVLRSQASARWPGIPVTKTLCLEEGKELVVIGTLYKQMILRPTILKEYTQDTTISEQLKRPNCCDSTDTLVLEDESARIALGGGHLQAGDFVTGVVIAVKGTFDATTGVFDVNDHLFAGLPQQQPLPPASEDKYLAVVSGLSLGGAAGSQSHLLLLDWLKGLLGGEEDAALCGSVVRLIIAGGSLTGAENLAAAAPGSKQQRFAMEAVHDVDRCLCQLASALPVDLMPGPGDLSNVALPQQAMNRCLFPGAANYESFRRASNPHACLVDGVHVLGTSGQNVADIQRYCEEDDVLNVMESNLRQRHLCPTAPDTLACQPFTDSDPFIVDECPHVYFVGNQREFSHRRLQGAAGQQVTLISVPSFARTGVLVLVNLRTLDCQPLTFDATL